MTWHSLKKFLFHSSAYLFANFSFYISIGIALRCISDRFGSGDGNIGFVIAVVILFWQIFAGVIFSIIFSVIKRRFKILKISVYFFINSPLTLFFIYANKNGLYYEFIYAVGGVLILVSFIYALLLKKG